jgi:hypothetical protein
VRTYQNQGVLKIEAAWKDIMKGKGGICDVVDNYRIAGGFMADRITGR